MTAHGVNMSDKRVIAVLAAFEGARTHRDYQAAKRLAAGLDIVHQFAIVDAAIDAHYRIRGAQ